MKMKKSIAPFWTEAALILLIVGVAVAGVVAYQRSDRSAPLSAWEKERLALTRKADALERENRTLRESVRALEARLAQRAGLTDTRAALSTDIAELHKRRDRARASAQAAAAEAEMARRTLAALEQQIDKKKTHLESMSAAAAEKKAALIKTRESLRQELESLTAKKTEAAKRAKAAAADVIRINQRLGALETTLGARQAELTAVSTEIADKRKALAALGDQADRESARLETTRDAAAREAAALAETRESLRKELEALTRQEAAAAKRIEAARAELLRVTKTLTALETTLETRRAELARMSEKVARREDASARTARTLTSEIEALKIQRDLAERQVDEGKSQAVRLRQEVDALQTKRRAQQAKLKSVEDALRRRKAALEAIPAPPAVQTPPPLTDRTVCLEAWARVAAEPKARARLAQLRQKIAAAETELCELNKRHKAAKEKLNPSTPEPSGGRQ